MNLRLVTKIIGIVLGATALCMVPSLLISLYTQDGIAWAFLAAMLIGLAASALLSRRRLDDNDHMQLRDGFATVAGCWLCLSLLCALPYWFSGALPNFFDALFESASGLTTTGASVVNDIEALPKSILFWRSFTQFLGGMGVLVLMLALLPRLGAGSAYLMRAESPGPIKSKLVPKIGQSAKILYGIYLILIGAETVCLRIAGMSWFDSICHAMCTISTGGFSTKNTSIAYFDSLLIDWIVIVFMLLAGISFALLFLMARREFETVRKDEELRLYLVTILGATAVIFLVLLLQGDMTPSFGLFTNTVFQVITIITSTGYATLDYMLWPTLAQCVLLALMVMGGCAGSTAGGVKGARVLLLHKMLSRSVHKVIHPRQVHVITLSGKRVDEGTLASICVYFYAYCALLVLGTVVVSLDNFGFAASFSAALTSLSNIGPGLDILGPSSNFFPLSNLSKMTLSILMLIGRLEIIPILVLLSPSGWVHK